METSIVKPLVSPPTLKPRRPHRATKAQPLTRSAIDGRSTALKQFDAIASGIAADLGGEDRLSTVERHLVEAFAGAAICVNDLNARLLLGEKIEILEFSQAISSVVRLAARIGVKRVAREIAPSVEDYLAHVNRQEGNE